MGDRELEKLLQLLEVPPARDEARERAMRAARTALSEPGFQAAGGRVRHWRLFVAAGSATAAAILLAFGLWSQQRPGLPHPGPGGSDDDWKQLVTQEARVLHQFREVFPRNLLAVISSSAGTELRLSPEPSATSDQPILVEICKPSGGCVRVLSFSGQTVEAQVDGRTISVELLVTGSQEVLICGRDFVWTSGAGQEAGDLRLRAEVLGA